MKKLKYIVLILLTLLLNIDISYASTNTYDRNELNNYGVNKQFKDEFDTEVVLNTPAVNKDEKIYDFGEILTDTEELALYNLASFFYNNTNMELIYLTASFNNTTDEENDNYVDNFYKYNDFGINFKYYSGIVVFRNCDNENPYYNIYAYGEAVLYYSDERLNNILDNISDEVLDKRFYTAFNEAGKLLYNYYQKGIPSGNSNLHIDDDGRIYRHYVDENGKIYYEYYDQHGNVIYEYDDDSGIFFLVPIFISLIVSGILTAVIILALLSKHKNIKRERYAYNYLDRNSIVYTHKSNDFITSRTTSTSRNTSSGSSGSISRSGRSIGSSVARSISRSSSSLRSSGRGRRG